MQDYVYLGSVPIEEECQQVGESYDTHKANLELRAFKAQLERMFPDTKGTYFKSKQEYHDFGSYKELVCVYNPDDEEQCEFAFEIEERTPTHWDEEAKNFLQANNYFTELVH